MNLAPVLATVLLFAVPGRTQETPRMPKVPRKDAVTLTSLEELKVNERNPNRGTGRGAAMLTHSLKEYGAGRSVLLDRKGNIIAGNKVVERARELGMRAVLVVRSDGKTLVAVQRTDLDLRDPRARELAIADNRAAEVGLDWDPQVLAELGAELDLTQFWLPEELDELLGDLAPAKPEGPEELALSSPERAAEMQRKWKTEDGQLWRIPSKNAAGKEHRLLCGDSTSAADVDRLFGGQLADLCVTSPPYAQQRDYGLGKFDWHVLMCGAFDQVVAHTHDHAHILVNLGLVHSDRRVQVYWNDFLLHAEGKGFPLFGWYVWDKGKSIPGEKHGRLPCAHEFVFEFNHDFLFHFNQEPGTVNKWVRTKVASRQKKKKATARQKDGTLSRWASAAKIGQEWRIPDSVIRIAPHAGADIGHPAMFSLAFAGFLIQTWSAKGDLVHEPFNGASTTMLASETLGRLCYGMDLQPAYVAVALERLSKEGLKPELVQTSARKGRA